MARHDRSGRDPTILLFDRDRAERLERLEDRPGRLRASHLLWVDLDGSSADGFGELSEVFGLDDEAVEALSDAATVTGFRDKGHYAHVTVNAPDRDAGDSPIEVECLVGDRWVVTSHERPVPVLEAFAHLTEGSGRTGELDGPGFLAALMDWVLEEFAGAFERLEQQLEQLDERAMRGEGSVEDEIDELVQLRRRAAALRRALVAHRPTLLALTHPELEALGDERSAERFRGLLERHAETVQLARDTRESIVSSFDVLIARTGHRTNEIVKLLTLASVIFLPGALVAGVMGMNFKVPLFEHAVGFWIVVGVIVAIALTTLAVARRRNWI